MMGGAGMDPMAGLGGASGSSEATAGSGRAIFNGQSAQQNAMMVSDVRQFMAILAGIAAGVLGLTSVAGLLFFVGTHLLVSGAVLFVGMGGDLKKYTGKEGKGAFLVEGVQGTGMSFMLFWTLFFGVCYLFG